MGCEKCLELLSEFLDGEIVREEREYLATHLDECLSCLYVRKDFELIIRLARELRDMFLHLPAPTFKRHILSNESQSASAT